MELSNNHVKDAKADFDKDKNLHEAEVLAEKFVKKLLGRVTGEEHHHKVIRGAKSEIAAAVTAGAFQIALHPHSTLEDLVDAVHTKVKAVETARLDNLDTLLSKIKGYL